MDEQTSKRAVRVSGMAQAHRNLKKQKQPLTHRLKTEECPSLLRFNELFTHGEQMTTAEKQHIDNGCPYCRLTTTMFHAEQRDTLNNIGTNASEPVPASASLDADYLRRIRQEAGLTAEGDLPAAKSMTLDAKGASLLLPEPEINDADAVPTDVPAALGPVSTPQSAPRTIQRFSLRRRIFASAYAAAAMVIVSFLLIHTWSVHKPIETPLITALGLTGSAPALLAHASEQLNADPFGSTRGNAESPAVKLLSPVDQYVLTTQPTLKWKLLLPNATVKSVELFSEGDRWTSTDAPAGSSCRVDKALKPDRRYTWRVNIVRAGVDSSASALLYVPSANVLTALQRDLTHLTPLQRGVLFLEAGQKERARKEFQMALILEKIPDTRQSIQHLLDQMGQQSSGR